MNLGKYGIWWSGAWNTADASVEEVAGEMERLGYSALWSSARWKPGISNVFRRLLDGTVDAVVATGILSVWANEPDVVGDIVAGLGDRFLLGIGTSHAPAVEASGQSYTQPYSKVERWLDALEQAEQPVARDHLVLAALGPRMLRLARDRSAGAHPYFVPVEHTARAREILGDGPLLAPEVAVVLDADPETARATARAYTTGYLALPNYANNLLSLGFDPDELENGGSDRLVDAVVAWGTPESVAKRVNEHRAVGADHVCIQVVSPSLEHFPLAGYRELAAVLG